MIPYGKQDINQSDIDAVIEVLKSDFLTQGPVTLKFEQIVCDYTTAKYGITTNSATSALHIACLALDLGRGDYLWTSPNSFVASANCGLYCGAKIDFVDINPKTYNISTQALEEKLIQAEKEGKLPKVVIPVHFAGQSCEMEKIHELSQKYEFKIIEDASHAIGGKYKNKSIGNCQYSDIAVFSFHPVKIITTGEGGIAVTNNSQLAERMTLLRSHGTTRKHDLMTHKADGDWYYQQLDLGFNYRLTDIQAVLGISQLGRLDEYVIKRNAIAKYYNEKLKELPLQLPIVNVEKYSSFHLYVILLELDSTDKTRREVFDYLRGEGVGVNVHYIPIHTQPYYKKMGFKTGDFPEVECYYSRAITIPIYPSLTNEEQDFIVNSLKTVLKR